MSTRSATTAKVVKGLQRSGKSWQGIADHLNALVASGKSGHASPSGKPWTESSACQKFGNKLEVSDDTKAIMRKMARQAKPMPKGLPWEPPKDPQKATVTLPLWVVKGFEEKDTMLVDLESRGEVKFVDEPQRIYGYSERGSIRFGRDPGKPKLREPRTEAFITFDLDTLQEHERAKILAYVKLREDERARFDSQFLDSNINTMWGVNDGWGPYNREGYISKLVQKWTRATGVEVNELIGKVPDQATRALLRRATNRLLMEMAGQREWNLALRQKLTGRVENEPWPPRTWPWNRPQERDRANLDGAL